MGKEKVYGVVRSGNGKSIICCVKEVVSTDCERTSPALVTKKNAKEFAENMNAYFGNEGYEYTVFKMKFKETI